MSTDENTARRRPGGAHRWRIPSGGHHSSRVVPPVQRRLHVPDLSGTWDQPEGRHQSRASQRLQRRLLVWVEIHYTA
jgi:hypothetical protein